MQNTFSKTLDRSNHPVIRYVVKGNTSRNAKARRKRGDRGLTIIARKSNASSLRELTITATMNITDDESFGADEHGTKTQTVSAFLSGQQTQNVLHMQKGVGGEVRVELDLIAQALVNGDIRITGTAKLFEGTSESSNDLDGIRDFNFLVPKDQFAPFAIEITNDDEGGDHAEIFMNCTNLAG